MENIHELLDGRVRLICANALSIPPPDKSVHCCVTSPPYWGLRDYGTANWVGGDANCDHSTPRSRDEDIRDGDKQGTSAGSRPNLQTECSCGAVREDDQLGLEKTPEEFVQKLVEVFREVRRRNCLAKLRGLVRRQPNVSSSEHQGRTEAQ